MKIHKVSFYTYSVGESLTIPNSTDNENESDFTGSAGVSLYQFFTKPTV